MSLLRLAARQRPWTRTFASESLPPSTGVYQVFDRAAKRKQRDRAASKDAGAASRTVDYVRDEVADRMMERLLVGGLYAVWHNLSKAIRA
jgi:NADH dehydrogenase [ubiquinone] 1 alpha subcomplex assembly factor 5